METHHYVHLIVTVAFDMSFCTSLNEQFFIIDIKLIILLNRLNIEIINITTLIN